MLVLHHTDGLASTLLLQLVHKLLSAFSVENRTLLLSVHHSGTLWDTQNHGNHGDSRTDSQVLRTFTGSGDAKPVLQ